MNIGQPTLVPNQVFNDHARKSSDHAMNWHYVLDALQTEWFRLGYPPYGGRAIRAIYSGSSAARCFFLFGSRILISITSCVDGHDALEDDITLCVLPQEIQDVTSVTVSAAKNLSDANPATEISIIGIGSVPGWEEDLCTEVLNAIYAEACDIHLDIGGDEYDKCSLAGMMARSLTDSDFAKTLRLMVQYRLLDFSEIDKCANRMCDKIKQAELPEETSK